MWLTMIKEGFFLQGW